MYFSLAEHFTIKLNWSEIYPISMLFCTCSQT
uniref:Uncharacterized protein n=1 Tax=Anguilla anguilla TaxID=7936 RepID=A0A0E9TY52_ANGAN